MGGKWIAGLGIVALGLTPAAYSLAGPNSASVAAQLKRVRLLGQNPNASSVLRLRTLLSDEAASRTVRAAAALALSSAIDLDSLPLLRRYSKTKRGVVRRASKRAVSRICPMRPKSHRYFVIIRQAKAVGRHAPDEEIALRIQVRRTLSQFGALAIWTRCENRMFFAMKAGTRLREVEVFARTVYSRGFINTTVDWVLHAYGSIVGSYTSTVRHPTGSKTKARKRIAAGLNAMRRRVGRALYSLPFATGPSAIIPRFPAHLRSPTARRISSSPPSYPLSRQVPAPPAVHDRLRSRWVQQRLLQARTLMAQRQFAMALPILRLASKSAPRNTSLRAEIALLLARMGDEGAALREIESLRRIAGDAPADKLRRRLNKHFRSRRQP